MIYPDVKWRDISEDRSLFDKENWDREILILTKSGSMHISWARHVEFTTYIDRGIEQLVTHYAYIN
jgi:hypothetical protein